MTAPVPEGRRPVGNAIIGVGIALVLIGVAVRLGWFSWFGRLPGDIRPPAPGGGFYFPVTSSIVISVVGTILLNLILRWLRQR
jgi:hypothetical protein